MPSLARVIKQAETVSVGGIFQIPGAEAVEPEREEQEEESKEMADFLPEQNTEKADAEETPADTAEEKTALEIQARREIEELSKRILKSVDAQAAQILQEAQEKAEKLRVQAQREGYGKALEQKAKELDKCIKEIDCKLEELAERQKQFFQAYTQELQDLAIDVAEKIMAHSIEADPMKMADLVMQAVASVKTQDWVTVEISDRLPELGEYLKKEYAEYLNSRRIEFVPQDAPEGTCVIQTSTGITDASIATQLGNLRSLIKAEDMQEGQ